MALPKRVKVSNAIWGLSRPLNAPMVRLIANAVSMIANEIKPRAPTVAMGFTKKRTKRVTTEFAPPKIVPTTLQMIQPAPAPSVTLFASMKQSPRPLVVMAI